MAKYVKKMSKAQKLHAQYINAKGYNGPIDIYDKVVQKFNNGFFIEFSMKPTQISRTYRITLIYIYGYQPFCYVISPNLIEIANREEEIPHLYSQENAELCLTYPNYKEWTSDKVIVDTYLPWIALWLFYYEQWLLTNEWEGDGVHPGDDVISVFERQLTSLQINRKMIANEKANKIYKKRKSQYIGEHKENELE